MPRYLYAIIILLATSSCIPLQIAPRIKEDKIKVGKRFKKDLPKSYTYIFEDPKDADEFYNYINIKYDLNHQLVDDKVPISIDGNTYYFSFYEVDKGTSGINLLGMFVDKALENNDMIPLFDRDGYIVRGDETWYIALTVIDQEMEDALHPDYSNRQDLLNFLKSMRTEYLTTTNYYDAYFKR